MWVDLSVLGFALAGPALMLASVTRWRLDPLSWRARLLLWVVAIAALALLLARQGSVSGALASVGLLQASSVSLLWGLAGAIGLAVTAGVATLVQRLAGAPVGDREMYERIAGLPLPRRCFLVLTAAVVEELLFRGVGIGFGGAVIGSTAMAALLSTTAFTLAHFRWRPHHLFQVAVAGATLALVFVASGGDLLACIVAHLLVDGLGFLIVPAIRRSRTSRREADPSSEMKEVQTVQGTSRSARCEPRSPD